MLGWAVTDHRDTGSMWHGIVTVSRITMSRSYKYYYYHHRVVVAADHFVTGPRYKYSWHRATLSRHMSLLQRHHDTPGLIDRHNVSGAGETIVIIDWCPDQCLLHCDCCDTQCSQWVCLPAPWFIMKGSSVFHPAPVAVIPQAAMRAMRAPQTLDLAWSKHFTLTLDTPGLVTKGETRRPGRRRTESSQYFFWW